MARKKDKGTEILEASGEVFVPETELVPDDGVPTQPVEEAPAEVPVVKTRRELKKERKEIKKHKKQVQKEAKLHSAKRTKAQNFWLAVLSLFVVICMIVCGVYVYRSYKNITGGAETTTASQSGGSSTGGSSTGGASTGGSSTTPGASAGTQTPSGGETTTAATDGSGDGAAAADLSTKAGIVEYYKAAHAKALASAKSVTRTYDNSLNYNSILEIGDSSVIAGIAQTLMGTFLKENTEALVFTGTDIAANFPPAGKGCTGLTADMIADGATCTEEGDNYIIKMAIDSTEENYDTGEKSQNLVSIVNEKSVTDAAGSMVTLDGLENRYVGANIVATVDKATGNLIALETDVPSYMIFAKAGVAFINVENCRIGLEYQQKWTVEY